VEQRQGQAPHYRAMRGEIQRTELLTLVSKGLKDGGLHPFPAEAQLSKESKIA